MKCWQLIILLCFTVRVQKNKECKHYVKYINELPIVSSPFSYIALSGTLDFLPMIKLPKGFTQSQA